MHGGTCPHLPQTCVPKVALNLTRVQTYIIEGERWRGKSASLSASEKGYQTFLLIMSLLLHPPRHCCHKKLIV